MKVRFTPFEKPIDFQVKNNFTWGLEYTKFNKYSLGIQCDEQLQKHIQNLVETNQTKNPLYGKTLYLKCSNISLKQREQLLNIGKCNVNVNFQCTGVYKNREQMYLAFQIMGLGLASFLENEQPAPADL